MRTIVHTLGYNVAELNREATESLYRLNPSKNFTHILADLSYPLGPTRLQWEDKRNAVEDNLYENIRTAKDFGSEFVRLPNRGVSGNWTSIANLYDVRRGDVIIGADPDERPVHEGWVDAMAEVMRHDTKIAIVSLMLPELLALEGFYENYIFAERMINGVRVWYGKSMCQWALIGISGSFVEACGNRIPHPDVAPIYGWIETACDAFMSKFGMTWVMLPDYHVGHIASSPLAQEWKNFNVGPGLDSGQITLEQWLNER